MIPQREMRQFARRLLKSRELALAGEIAAGYTELLDGFEAAQADTRTGAPGAAILTAEYRLALEIYSHAYGVREAPESEEVVLKGVGRRRSSSRRSTPYRSPVVWRRKVRQPRDS